MKNWFLIAILLTCATFSFGQTECNNLIEDANDLYHSGNYDECIRRLERGLKECNLSKGKKEKAYILLINSNIEKDSIPSVDKYFKKLLLNNPTFKLKDYDGIDDFKTNFNSYYVFPKLSFGARIYYCLPKIVVDSNYFVMPGVQEKKTYEAEYGINLAFMVEYRLNKRFTQFSELGYFKLDYNFTAENSYWKLSVNEKLNYLQWDIGTKLYFNNYRRLNYYIMGGVSNHFLLNSKLNVATREFVPLDIYDSGIGRIDSITSGISNFNSREMRNPYIPHILLGGGLLYKFGKFAYGLDFRYNIGLKWINNPEQRIHYPDLVSRQDYMDSNFRMSRMDISVTAVYMLNKVKSKRLKYE